MCSRAFLSRDLLIRTPYYLCIIDVLSSLSWALPPHRAGPYSHELLLALRIIQIKEDRHSKVAFLFYYLSLDWLNGQDVDIFILKIQEFKNDRSLSDAQIAKIVRWVDSGSPLGDLKDMPPPKTSRVKTPGSSRRQYGQPDGDQVA